VCDICQEILLGGAALREHMEEAHPKPNEETRSCLGMANSARSLRAALAVEAAGREVAEASLATTEAALRQAEAAFAQVLEAKDRRIKGLEAGVKILQEQVKVLQGKVMEVEENEIKETDDEEELMDMAENNNEKPTNTSVAKSLVIPKFASTVAKEGVKIVLRGVKGTAGKRKHEKGEDRKEDMSHESLQKNKKMESDIIVKVKKIKIGAGKKKLNIQEGNGKILVSKTESSDEAKEEEIEEKLKNTKENVPKSKAGKHVEQDKGEEKPEDQVQVDGGRWMGVGERVPGEVVCGKCGQVVATKESLRLHTCGAFMDTNRPEGNTRRRAVGKPVWRQLQL